MLQVGLREANMHFSKYLKIVREGQEVVVTERGTPVAIIKPLIKEETPEDRVRLLEEQGILRKAVKGKFPLGSQITIAGKPLSESVIEGRKNRFK
ncbi:MAG: type II toxin-antitoxin system prevent-host-death family antitoxin [Nitrospinae bacterium]|nr:type II toxin-antitoxin system prevent-host-death family antitoxin [Nitrospinota bacterium]MBI3815057.1 type II toxin-antitoxin system prevent-host-death family antitoxin [Nitrospinota bacterium]